MAITVYWGYQGDSWLRAKEPEPIYKVFCKNLSNQKNDLIYCPATKDYMNNIFSLKSLFDYDFNLPENKKINEVYSNKYDQNFFDNHVFVRSREDKLFSFMQRFIFFTEEKSLLMSAGMLPFLEDNNITKRCIVIPGTFDIGRWFRPLDFAFYLKESYDEFKIEEEEIFQYIKFHTTEKIIFKQFRVTEEIKKIILDGDSAKNFRKKKLRDLKEYYLMMKNKNYLVNLIRNSLLE